MCLQLVDEAVARPAEEEVTENEERRRRESQREERAAVGHLAADEDAAIGTDQVHHRVEAAEGLVLGREVADVVEDRTEEEEQVQEHAEKVLRVAERYVERGREVG